jgi:hypothetical protein
MAETPCCSTFGVFSDGCWGVEPDSFAWLDSEAIKCTIDDLRRQSPVLRVKVTGPIVLLPPSPSHTSTHAGFNSLHLGSAIIQLDSIRIVRHDIWCMTRTRLQHVLFEAVHILQGVWDNISEHTQATRIGTCDFTWHCRPPKWC